VPVTAEETAGYAQVDGKGRVSLAKPIRQALGLSAGSTVAYVRMGEAVMLIPQDAHLTHVMGAAMRALENARISVDDLMEALPRAREESVIEHYGAEFMDKLERAAEEQSASTSAR